MCGAGAWFAIMSQQVYIGIYLQLGRGFDPIVSGLLLLAAPLVGLVMFPLAGALVQRTGVDRSLVVGATLTLLGGAGMLTWSGDTSVPILFGVMMVSGLGLSLALVASAAGALSQFAPEEAATGSAVFNSIRQLGAALGVAAPAVAFELLAHGSRTPDAVLAGSTAAFLLRTVVLVVPVVVAVAAWLRLGRSRGSALTEAVVATD